MITIMNEDRDRVNSTILHSILGILFFGTPHTGMNIGSLVQMAQERPNRKLVESLDIDSPSLKILDDRFHTTVRSLNPAPELIAFFETKLSASARKVAHFPYRPLSWRNFVNMQLNQVVSEDRDGNILETWRMDGAESLAVDERSATYNIRKRYPIDRDHSDMVKFESRYNLYYNIVRNHIRSLLEQPRDRSDIEHGFQDEQSSPMERVGNQCSESSVQGSPDQENVKGGSHEDKTEHQEDSRKENSGEAQTERKKGLHGRSRFLRRMRFTRQ